MSPADLASAAPHAMGSPRVKEGGEHLLCGWGRTAPTRARVLRPRTAEQVAHVLAAPAVRRPVEVRSRSDRRGDRARCGAQLRRRRPERGRRGDRCDCAAGADRGGRRRFVRAGWRRGDLCAAARVAGRTRPHAAGRSRHPPSDGRRGDRERCSRQEPSRETAASRGTCGRSRSAPPPTARCSSAPSATPRSFMPRSAAWDSPASWSRRRSASRRCATPAPSPTSIASTRSSRRSPGLRGATPPLHDRVDRSARRGRRVRARGAHALRGRPRGGVTRWEGGDGAEAQGWRWASGAARKVRKESPGAFADAATGGAGAASISLRPRHHRPARLPGRGAAPRGGARLQRAALAHGAPPRARRGRSA